MNERLTRWDAEEHLQMPWDTRLHLEACSEEDPGDGSLTRAALNDIVRSGNMSRLACDVRMSREGLYKELPRNGNPSHAKVIGVTRALGMHLRIAAWRRITRSTGPLSENAPCPTA